MAHVLGDRPAFAAVTLLEHTSITASSPVAYDVAIGRTIAFSASSLFNPTASVKAADVLVAGVVLVKRDDSPFPIIVGALRGRPAHRACLDFCDHNDQLTVFSRGLEIESDHTYRLPAGRYGLVVVTYQAPVSVQLRLPGLPAGQTVLTDARAAEVEAAELPDLDAPPGTQRFGRSLHLRSPGITFHQFVVAGTYGPNQTELCWYRGVPASPDAYGRGCPGAETATSSVVTGGVDGASGKTLVMYGDKAFLDPGTYGLGGNATVNGQATRDAIGATIGLAEPAVAPAKPDPAGRLSLLSGAVLRQRSLVVTALCRSRYDCRGVLRHGTGSRSTITVASGQRRPVVLRLTNRDARTLRHMGRRYTRVQVADLRGVRSLRVRYR